MGSGKTTVGKKLAKKLDFQFIDLDDVIEKKSGLAISAYFEEFGEENFRLFERETLRETFHLNRVVISTGGGVPCFFNNIGEILENGLSFYLKANANLLFSRLKDAKDQRPLISNLSNEQLTMNLEALLEKREIFYSKANYSVNAINPLDEMLLIINNLSMKH